MTRVLCLLLAIGSAGCAVNTIGADNPNTPGATGRVVLPGNNSTIAGDAEATYLQQKWGIGRER